MRLPRIIRPPRRANRSRERWPSPLVAGNGIQKLMLCLPFAAQDWWLRGGRGPSMRYTDIAIIGGGLAGSTAAAMLGRAGIASLLIDPHEIYPLDFRVEKLSCCEQLDRFARTGLAEAVLPSATHDGENWIARFGYLLDKPP